MEPEDIFNLFEGSCPKCLCDVKIKSIGGTPRFLRDYRFEVHGVERTVWKSHDDMDAIGGITFVCPSGHEFYVECTPHGDWV